MIAGAHVWRGRLGTVVLGPTEHRVAGYLAGRTSAGRVTFPTSAIAIACRLERSEAYRITARLRTLGLFGIENDRGGARGGRRWWRTATPHDGAELDAVKHRQAWRRVVAWATWRAARAARRLEAIRDHLRRVQLGPVPRATAASGPATCPAGPRTLSAAGLPPARSPAPSEFTLRMLEAGAGPVLERLGILR